MRVIHSRNVFFHVRLNPVWRSLQFMCRNGTLKQRVGIVLIWTFSVHSEPSSGVGNGFLQFSRRKFIQSLSRSALVLPLENVLALALPSRSRAFAQTKGGEAPARQETPANEKDLGVQFVNVAKD